MKKFPSILPSNYREYVTKPVEVRARQLSEPETVRCYNGRKIGQAGDFIVVDGNRVMLMRSDRFMSRYQEKTNAFRK